MSKNAKQSPSARSLKRPVHKLQPGEELIKSSVAAIELHKVNEIARLLWLPEGLSDEDRNARMLLALELYESMAPQDGLEGMLAAQMVGTHHAALECLRRAALENQTYAGRDMALKHAQKLMTLYTQQIAALNKHRGKGQQKVTVEYVNVEAGGKAIVGNVEVGSKAAQATGAPAAPALENTPGISVSADVPKTAKRKR